MKMEKRWLWSELGVSNVQIHHNIKTENSKNRRKTKSRAKGNGKPQAAAGHHGRGDHHGQTVASTTGRGDHHGQTVVVTVVAARFVPVRCVLGSFGASSWAAGFAFLGVFWASLQASFDPHGPHFLTWIHLKYFSQNLGLNYRNLQ